jgi:hypothetical protein
VLTLNRAAINRRPILLGLTAIAEAMMDARRSHGFEGNEAGRWRNGS